MSELNIHQKMIEVRKVIDVFTKDTKGFNYSYVSGSQVLGKIKEKMDELGILLYPEMKELEHSTYDYQQYNKKTQQMESKTDFVVSGTMRYLIVNADNPSDMIVVDWNLYGQQDDISKAFGSGTTYSERYFLLKFLNVPTDDDDPDKRQGGAKSKGVSKASEKQLNFVDMLLNKNVSDKFSKEDLYTHLKQKMNTDVEMENWSAQQASQAIKILQGDK